jgi:hypothetical protein
MQLDSLETIFINGQALKNRVRSSVNDFDAMKVASRNPDRYRLPTLSRDESRPNMFKARDAALAERMQRCHSSDPWVREIITQWCNMSTLPAGDADFWREIGFMEAVRAGRDLQIRRFLDDDGWAWIVIRDVPSHWVHRRRLPEAARQQMVQAARRRKQEFKSRW